MIEENMNEMIRENIRRAIEEGKGNIKISPELEHVLTSICFFMYKQGMKDAFKMSEMAVKIAKENTDK